MNTSPTGGIVRSYTGADEASIQRAFLADATVAKQQGYEPLTTFRDQATGALVVSYGRRRPAVRRFVGAVAIALLFPLGLAVATALVIVRPLSSEPALTAVAGLVIGSLIGVRVVRLRGWRPLLGVGLASIAVWMVIGFALMAWTAHEQEDSIASALPQSIGSVDLVYQGTGSLAESDLSVIESAELNDIVSTVGKTRADFELAYSQTTPSEVGQGFLLLAAMRIDGVPATTWLDDLTTMVGRKGSREFRWEEVSGRRVKMFAIPGRIWAFAAASDDVLYLAMADYEAPGLAEVLSSLP